MRRGTLLLLFFIILLAAGSSFVVFWPNPVDGKPWNGLNNPYTITQGLDLAGGIQVLLVPKEGTNPERERVEEARKVLEQRINGLSVREPSLRVLEAGGKYSILIEMPHFSGNEQETIDALLSTGELEFWNTGPQPNGVLPEGQEFIPEQFAQYNPDGPQFKGGDLDPGSLGVSLQETGALYQINFKMKNHAIGKFGDFTGNNIGNGLTITLDRVVIASANINDRIDGDGRITGSFTQDQAQSIVNTLKYGALPVSLVKESESFVDATLGQDAIQRSLLAGAVGISAIFLFMLFYYRLPGLLANIALVLYSVMSFAIFKMMGITMTLAGIAGFVLSIGMAVDANVLVFERVKEELRAGRILSAAIDIGWKRAWPSIRDSNSSTLITCAVLYAFGSNFGASLIVGFATTLFLGVLISLFTEITVTRTLLNLLIPTGAINHPALFGLSAKEIPAATFARRGSAV